MTTRLSLFLLIFPIIQACSTIPHAKEAKNSPIRIPQSATDIFDTWGNYGNGEPGFFGRSCEGREVRDGWDDSFTEFGLILRADGTFSAFFNGGHEPAVEKIRTLTGRFAVQQGQITLTHSPHFLTGANAPRYKEIFNFELSKEGEVLTLRSIAKDNKSVCAGNFEIRLRRGKYVPFERFLNIE